MDSESSLKIPEKFTAVIRDFLADLSNTFPEYTYLWSIYEDPMRIPELYQYCLTIYPERFFDILYQNDSIFEPESEINTLFLPNVEFKMLFSVPDISENTKKAMWKYLQLILMTIMDGIKEKSAFGQTADLFQGIDEAELQTKLYDTIEELSNFFTKGFSGEMPKSDDQGDNDETPNLVPPEENDSSTNGMPSGDDLHNHLKGLFDGKIGNLAKELADELSGDLMEEFGDLNAESSTNDIFKNIMKDPSKLMGMMKKVSSKLDEKMKSGDISQEDIMKELGELMGGLKGMGGVGGSDMKNILKTLMKKLGPMLGGMKGMDNMENIEEMLEKMMGAFSGGAGGINKAKMGQMNSIQKHKERMRAKLEKKRQQAQAVEALLESQKAIQKEGIHLEQTENPDHFTFKIDGDEGQEKSSVKPPNDDWLDEEPIQKKSNTSNKKGKAKGKGKK